MTTSNLVLLAIVLLAAIGCGSDSGDDGLTTSEVRMSSRIDEIAKSSEGNWDKVSEADKEYLVKEVAQGSEQSAKMMLQAKAGKLNGAPGGGK